jgi:hypothetical protein
MLKRISFIGFSLLATAAFAAANDSQATTALTIQPGQGNALTFVVPQTTVQAPYALTGQTESAPQVQLFRAGQSDVMIEKF